MDEWTTYRLTGKMLEFFSYVNPETNFEYFNINFTGIGT